MAIQYTLDQVREAKRVLEQELDKVIQQRLRVFAETTGYRVESLDAQFLTLQNVDRPEPIPVFQRIKVKLEDI